jgi:hypothetical protein
MRKHNDHPAMKASTTRNILAGNCLAIACAAAFGAQVVVTPGSAAGYSFYPPAQSTSTNGAQETLVTCYVTPTANTRTLVMSSRNWFGYTKPVTVYYKMVGGGAGWAALPGTGTLLPQMVSGGGSTAILKNGTLLNYAKGMSASEIPAGRSVVSGSFTVTNSDTLTFTLGGGSGGGIVAANYTGVWNYYGYVGGGGSGYYGGGSGQNQSFMSPAYPSAGAAIATGGTNLAGGTGITNGGLAFGATNTNSGWNAGGGNGASSGANPSFGYWNGYLLMNYNTGGGGGQGAHGNTAGDINGGFYCPNPATGRPATMPIATSFDLDSSAGTPGYMFMYSDPASNPHTCYAGGGFGQIVLQYEAPTCDVIPQWNQP